MTRGTAVRKSAKVADIVICIFLTVSAVWTGAVFSGHKADFPILCRKGATGDIKSGAAN